TILLLTAPLITGRTDASLKTLSQREYKKLELNLREQGRQADDLIGPDADAILSSCAPAFDRGRIESLLDRREQLSEVMERWATRSIWIISYDDADYPQRLKTRLNTTAPLILY